MSKRITFVLPYVLPIAVFVLYGLLLASGCSSKDDQPGQAGEPEVVEAAAPDTAVIVPDTVNVEENLNYTESPTMAGYITATTLNVRSGPGTGNTVVSYLFKGDRVDIYESQGEGGDTWYRVNDAAGYVDGWIYGKYVSGSTVVSDFVIPEDYKEPRTPTVVTNVTAQYVGVRACQRCHRQPHGEFSMGAYGVWRDHFHSDAFRTLNRPYTKALAAKRGIDDPTTDWRCVKCHVTALGVSEDRLGPGYNHEEGVTCEACHGPGGDYLNDHWEGQPGYASREANGFRIFRDMKERDLMCRSCHNELSPTYKPFNVAAFSAAIRHWDEDREQFQEIALEEETAQEPPRPVAPQPRPQPKPAPAPPPVTRTPPPQATEQPQQPQAQQPQQPQAQQPQAQQPQQPQQQPQAQQPQQPQAQPPKVEAVRKGPKDVMLDTQGKRGKVFFPHQAHFDYVEVEQEGNNCQVCHHTTKVGQTPELCGSCHKIEPTASAPNREKAFHSSCRTCHKEVQAGPTSCSDCHAK